MILVIFTTLFVFLLIVQFYLTPIFSFLDNVVFKRKSLFEHYHPKRLTTHDFELAPIPTGHINHDGSFVFGSEIILREQLLDQDLLFDSFYVKKMPDGYIYLETSRQTGPITIGTLGQEAYRSEALEVTIESSGRVIVAKTSPDGDRLENRYGNYPPSRQSFNIPIPEIVEEIPPRRGMYK